MSAKFEGLTLVLYNAPKVLDWLISGYLAGQFNVLRLGCAARQSWTTLARWLLSCLEWNSLVCQEMSPQYTVASHRIIFGCIPRCSYVVRINGPGPCEVIYSQNSNVMRRSLTETNIFLGISCFSHSPQCHSCILIRTKNLFIWKKSLPSTHYFILNVVRRNPSAVLYVAHLRLRFERGYGADLRKISIFLKSAPYSAHWVLQSIVSFYLSLVEISL